MKKKVLTFVANNWNREAMRNNAFIKSIRNPPMAICNHLIGPEHTPAHRMITGIIIMACGVLFSKSGVGIWHIFTDLIGYAVHGVGAIPFIEHIEKWRAKGNENKDNDKK